jgi:membrane fusion protein (multidrug efflux system)
MRYLSAIGAVIAMSLAGCGDDNTIEAKKELLEKKKIELAKLENEVRQLEQEVLASDSSYTTTTDTRVVVQAMDISPARFEHFLEVNGTVDALENVRVSTETGGIITKMLVKEGDRVKAGQVLAHINSSVLDKSVEEVDNALALAQTVYERQSRLWEQKIGSEMQYLQAKNTYEGLLKKKETLGAQRSMGMVKAPFSGIVDAIYTDEGELAAPGLPILQLVNPTKMKVTADVAESYAPVIRQGNEVIVNFPAFGKEVKAPLKRVASSINPANRSFKVELQIDNGDEAIKPNGVAVIKLRDFVADSALAVPSRCISKDAKGEFLFTIGKAEGKEVAQKTYITTDRTSQGLTMVLTGLKKGDRVVTEGYNEVTTGNEVRVVK